LVGKGRERKKRKIFVPFSSYSLRNRKFQKNSKNIPKIKKYHYGLFQAKIGWKMPRKREYKIILPFHSNTTRNRKFQKNSRKNFKNLKNTIMDSFQAKIGWKRP